MENAASIGEPAALHGKFYKGIVALAAQAAAAFPVDSSPDGVSGIGASADGGIGGRSADEKPGTG